MSEIKIISNTWNNYVLCTDTALT